MCKALKLQKFLSCSDNTLSSWFTDDVCDNFNFYHEEWGVNTSQEFEAILHSLLTVASIKKIFLMIMLFSLSCRNLSAFFIIFCIFMKSLLKGTCQLLSVILSFQYRELFSWIYLQTEPGKVINNYQTYRYFHSGLNFLLNTS